MLVHLTTHPNVNERFVSALDRSVQIVPSTDELRRLLAAPPRPLTAVIIDLTAIGDDQALLSEADGALPDGVHASRYNGPACAGISGIIGELKERIKQ